MGVLEQSMIGCPAGRTAHASLSDQARAAWLEQLVQQLAESAPVAFFALDASGAVAVWNTEASNLFGWGAEEVLGRPVSDPILPAPFSLEELAREVPRGSEGPPVNGQRIRLTGAGAQARARRLPANGAGTAGPAGPHSWARQEVRDSADPHQRTTGRG